MFQITHLFIHTDLVEQWLDLVGCCDFAELLIIKILQVKD